MADDDLGGGSRIQVLGVNQLQSSIDKLTSAVQSLTGRMSGPGSGGGTPTLNQVAAGSNGGGQAFASAAGNYTPPPAGTYPSAAGTYTPPPAGFNYAGGGLAGGASGGAGPTLNQSSSGGNGGWAGTAIGAFSGAMGAASAIQSSGLMNNIAGAGSGALSGMSSMSAYLATGALYGGSATGMQGQLRTLNTIASSANDLSQGLGILSYGSGAWGGRNALFSGMSGAANMAGYLNPALGFTGAAQLGQQLYSQQMSMNMLSMGYGLTPRTMRGGTNSIQAVNQAILQRTFGGQSSVNQKAFNAAAAPGGTLWYNLQNLGLTGSSLTNTEGMLGAQNQLANAGWSNARIQSAFSGAAKGNKNSISQLGGVLGSNFTNNILQTLKDKTAVSTQRSGEEEQGYQSGLAKSVQLLNQFNEAMNKLLRGSLGKYTGYAKGFVAGNGNNPVSWIEQAIGAGPLGFATTGLSSILGGGAASPTSKSSSGSGNSVQSARGASKTNTGVSGAAKAAVGWAEQELGVPYLWGGEQPGVGFDCSGLTQWSYAQAGVKIPRTSQQQWAALGRSHSVPMNQVQAGDLIFTAGSDGTYDAPGHVAMMVNNHTLIQAEQTGTNIMFTPYNPKEWDHAARPTGPGVAGTGPGAGGQGSSGTLTGSGMAGASGFGGYSEGGGMGSTEEVDAINGGGGGFMSGFLGNTGFTGSKGSRNPGTGGSAPGAPGNPSKNAQLARTMAAKKGWTGTQWNDLYALWTRESNFRTNATNSSSGAYGIPQSLPGSKMASAGPDWRTNPATQIAWGLSYIAGRYKNPAGAWAHEESMGWYSRGTRHAAPGLAVVGEDGPEVVDLGKGGQSIMTSGQSSGLMAGLRSGQYGQGGPSISVTISPGAISVSGAGIGSGSDVSSSLRELGSQITQVIEQSDLINKLASGMSN